MSYTVIIMTITIRQELILTRGVSGSGKSTRAKAWVAEDPANRRRVNRDNLRMSVYGAYVLEADTVPDGLNVSQKENYISEIQTNSVRNFLRAGYSVIIDDTNLMGKVVRGWYSIAKEFDAKFTVMDVEVTLDEALKNNAKRASLGGRDVPTHVIERQFTRHTCNTSGKLNKLPPLMTDTGTKVSGSKYVADESKPKAWIFDVDGTLTVAGGRNIYDETLVLNDVPNWPVVNLAKTLIESGAQVIVTSARSEFCRTDTERWLREVAGIDFTALFLRTVEEQKDKIKDSVVKLRLFDTYIRNDYNIQGVFDDRDAVVALWRDLGLFCAQVNYGNF
jgi:predicted kinase